MAALQANASLVTFDDLSGSEPQIQNGYAGLNWNNFYAVDGENYWTPSGYQAGVESKNMVAFNGYGNTAVISNQKFDLNSAYLTAAWRDNLQVQVIGSLGSKVLYDKTYTLSATARTQILFNYLGIDSVTFKSTGGTDHQGYYQAWNNTTQFAMDNMVINAVPEPSNYVAGVSVLGMLVLAWRKRK